MFGDGEEVIVLRGEHKGRIGTVCDSNLRDTAVYFEDENSLGVWHADVFRFPTHDLMYTEVYEERVQSGEIESVGDTFGLLGDMDVGGR